MSSVSGGAGGLERVFVGGGSIGESGAGVGGKHRQGAYVGELQRRRLLSAMVEVLGVHGLEGATVGRICKRGGVSRRTFYDSFEDRDACFGAALELAIKRLTHGVVLAYSPELSWRERIRAALRVLLDCFDEEPGLARLCLVETLKAGPEVLERRGELLEVLAGVVDEGRGEVRGVSPPPLAAESVVGGAISVIHARLLQCDARSRVACPRMGELLNPLMSLIVLPYLGPAAARKELDRPAPLPPVGRAGSNGRAPMVADDPFRDLPIRITFRTVRVLATIGDAPEASNREIGEVAGVSDQGQMSKLLRRLERVGLIENLGAGQVRGERNAWRLTPHGHGVLHAIGEDSGRTSQPIALDLDT